MSFDEDVAAKLMSRCHMAQAADNLEDDRFCRIEVARTAADVAGIELNLVQALSGFLRVISTRFRPSCREPGLGAIHGRFTDQNLKNFVRVSKAGPCR